MSKLAGIKEKIGALQAKLGEKFKFLAPKPAEGKKTSASSGVSIGNIYQEGGTFTRLQILCMYALALLALASGGIALRKILPHFASSKDEQKLRQDYTHELEAANKRVEENASAVSLGKFTANSFNTEGKSTHLMLDIWVKVSDAKTAAVVDRQEAVMHDRVVEVMETLFQEKVSLLEKEGNELAKQRILTALNAALPYGKVEEVFFHNMVVQ